MSELYLGMISGTSVDSIDVALVDFSSGNPGLIASHNKPWPEAVRRDIFATRSLDDDELHNLTQLDNQSAEVFAQAANECLQAAGIEHSAIRAIGSHGQTIRHRPDCDQPFSLQLGNAERIAQLTNIDVIADFRSADMAAGGQGAPLVPAFHQAVFSDTGSNRVIVNIGGIANITTLPKDAAVAVTGFDTGPGNNLMDAWITKHRQQQYDESGAFAASGKTDAYLLAKCLSDDYFSLAPPKSTGFELFNLAWLDTLIDKDMAAEDVQSTLCDLTATSITRDINRYAADTDEIYICGGGAHNTELMQRLQAMCRSPVSSTEKLGVHPDWVEAMTFAWLARQQLKQLPGNIPSVTGASQPRILGNLTASDAE